MEQKIKIYDPSVDAYRSIDIDKAKLFVESAKKAEIEIKKLEIKSK
jgi:hypothetical protein